MMSDREHGYARYKLDGCRCYPCAAAMSDYVRNRKRAIAYGRWEPYVDAEPVRVHVKTLSEFGIGWKRVAALAGISSGSMSKLLYGVPSQGRDPSKRIRPEAAVKILAIEPTLDLLGAAVSIDASGTRRRLQALVATGWSQSKLGVRLGIDPQNFSSMLRRAKVLVGTARAVRDLYDELWDQAPPEGTHRDKIAASRARNHAATKSWLPPQAWDDDLIDLPDDALKAELDRLVALMDDAEVSRCAVACYRQGEKSVLIAAGAREHSRRCKAKTRAGAAA
ncbi:hypothetical protein OIE13_22660 [Streptosporangium sp. NBC_01810]|uniref:hypothetical protein n=1 Tax=Streptosporangium sp. NBC_01810 TaxID=2975951 RepID=UPI002DDB2699|nr:hypothetical protein [Streptosporangium sp. NBC_01810]WSA23747.1 hypothetical protein OIE13_22660 [Streptosporangium sp. NBC_01810]